MNASWMFSSIMVSMLIGAAALCVERVLMLRRGTPVRWVWIAAIAFSIGWSGWWLLPAPAIKESTQGAPSASSVWSEDVVTPSAMSEFTLSPSTVLANDVPASRWGTQVEALRVPQLSEQAERRLRLVSFGMSVALLLALAWSNTRLMRERRRWRATSLLNTEVLVSEGFGPAIVGMRRPAIVVPPWVLAVDTSAQRTILLHEDEHRRAGDQWLLLASFGALVLSPWNVVIWLMRRRLARAVELDCDERVLAHGVADVDYANVLLSAWQFARGSMPWIPSPALAEHVSRLGRRVEHLMRPMPRRRIMKTIGGLFTSVLLVGAAVFVPAPQQAQSRPLPVPPPTAVPSVPTPQSAPTPVATPAPSIPAPGPRPSVRSTVVGTIPVPTGERVQMPSVPTPASVEPAGVQQQRARLLVVAPWDSASTPLVNAVHEALARDLLGKPVDLLSRSVFVTSASAAGFQPYGTLRVRLETDSKGFAPPDVKKLGALVRADVVIGLQVRQASGFFHVYASVIAAGDSAPHRILEGDGSVDGISNSLIRALHADPAYSRFAPIKTPEDLLKLMTQVRDELLRSQLLVQKAKADLRRLQSDTASAAPAHLFVDSIATRLAETEIKRAQALAIYEPWATTVRNLDAQISAYQEQLFAMSRSASAPRRVAEFVLKRLDERQVALAITHRQLLVTYLATRPEVKVIAAEELQVEQRRAELRASLQLAPERDGQK